MAQTTFEKLEVYQLAERTSDIIWVMVLRWDSFARRVVGEQLAHAADSVGANIAEGTGRGSFRTTIASFASHVDRYMRQSIGSAARTGVA